MKLVFCTYSPASDVSLSLIFLGRPTDFTLVGDFGPVLVIK